jgi:hypothetical protein
MRERPQFGTTDDHLHNPDERTFSHRHGRAHRGMTVRPGTAIGVDPEFLSTAAGSLISRSMLLPVPR